MAQIRLSGVLRKGSLDGGATAPLTPLDVRVIASTCRDLEAEAAEGRFWGGLYYLLSVVAIQVPPLRQRQEDLRSLVEQRLARALAKRGASVGERPCRFTEEAGEYLLNHDWPGNLSELDNVVAHAVALTSGRDIGREALVLRPRAMRRQSLDTITVPLVGSIYTMGRLIIEEMIKRCGGNKSAAARALGLHRRTMYRVLERAGVDDLSAEKREGRQTMRRTHHA